MCNLYSITTNQAAIIALFRVVNRYVGNLAPMPGVFPDYRAPVVRNGADGRELATARWGMPSSSKALMDATKKRAEKLQAKGKSVDFTELLRMEPDGGTTNIRNVRSKHWTRWLGPEHRCVVPFNSFSEFNKAEGGDIWFALDDSRPLACFAGIWTNWTSVRKVKEGETTNDLYAFLTTEPNAGVGVFRSEGAARRRAFPRVACLARLPMQHLRDRRFELATHQAVGALRDGPRRRRRVAARNGRQLLPWIDEPFERDRLGIRARTLHRLLAVFQAAVGPVDRVLAIAEVQGDLAETETGVPVGRDPAALEIVQPGVDADDAQRAARLFDDALGRAAAAVGDDDDGGPA